MRNPRRSRRAAFAALTAAALLLTTPVLVQAKDKEAPKVAESTAAAGQPIAVTVDGTKVMLPDGTHVKLQITDTISSNKSKEGDEVHYVVDEDVQGDGGKVTKAKGAGGLGRGGKLEFTCEYVTAVDGTKIPLRGQQTTEGKGSKGSMLAVGLLVTPLGFFMKGHNITVKEGTVTTVYINTAPVVAAAPAGK